MTDNAAASPSLLQSVGAAIGIGVIIALAASLNDFWCIEGFEQLAGAGKGTALLKGLLFALAEPSLFYPVLAGFAVLALVLTRFGLLFRQGTPGRLLGALSPLALLFLSVVWVLLLAPDTECGTWTGIRNLLQITGVSLGFMAVVLLVRRADRTAV